MKEPCLSPLCRRPSVSKRPTNLGLTFFQNMTHQRTTIPNQFKTLEEHISIIAVQEAASVSTSITAKFKQILDDLRLLEATIKVTFQEAQSEIRQPNRTALLADQPLILHHRPNRHTRARNTTIQTIHRAPFGRTREIRVSCLCNSE